MLCGSYEEIASVSTNITLSVVLWTVTAAFYILMANHLFYAKKGIFLAHEAGTQGQKLCPATGSKAEAPRGLLVGSPRRPHCVLPPLTQLLLLTPRSAAPSGLPLWPPFVQAVMAFQEKQVALLDNRSATVANNAWKGPCAEKK